MEKNNYLVIGSGPSSAAAATSLIAKGHFVTMVDVANDLPDNINLEIKKISKLNYKNWSQKDKSILQPINNISSPGGVPIKTLFGSTFPYKDSEYVINQKNLPEGFDQYPSHAYGGFSRVWGATAMRFHPEDFKSWPITISDKNYRAIEELISITSYNDDLKKEFRLPSQSLGIKATNQAEKILSLLKINKSKETLGKVKFGKSRLALKKTCQLCSNCLYGCPYNDIFSSTDLIQKLIPKKNFNLIKGLRAVKIIESEKNVTVVCENESNDQVLLNGDRVFVGAGVLNTSLLILNTLDEWEKKVSLKDTQYFLLPFIGPKADLTEPKHTLSQFFIEIKDDCLSNHNIHTQFYTYNEMYKKEIFSKIKAISKLPGIDTIVEFLSQRLIVAQGYLHSSDSRTTLLSLCGDKKNPKLRIEPQLQNKHYIKKVKNIWKRLSQIGRECSLTALPFLGKITDIGRGYHTGGTFPMSESPSGLDSDLIGRPANLKRTHIIDSSCWPNVPSATVTLTLMANSMRISEEAMSLDMKKDIKN
jgi:hypothetical protein